LIGVSSSHIDLSDSIAGFTVAAYGLVIVTAWVLPETRGRVLVVETQLDSTDALAPAAATAES
jgi:hypothetical protein